MSARKKASSLLLIAGVACAGNGSAPAPETPAAAPPTVAGPMWLGADHVLAACDATVRRTEAQVADLVAKPALQTELDLRPYNRVRFEMDRVRSTAELVAAAHPEHGVRGAAEVCVQALDKLEGELARDRELYEAIRAVDTSAMSSGAQRFVAKLLQDFLRAGVDEDATTRARLRALDAEMVRLEQTFSRRIREGRGWIAVAPSGLDGLPEDFVEAHPPDWQGLVELTTDYTDFFPVLTYAHDESVREALYRAFLNRAHPENDEVLEALLAARHEYARLLGFDSWTAYMAEDKMIGSAEAIDAFVEELAAAVRPRMEEEREILLALKKKDEPRADAIEVWDRFYYVEKARNQRYGVDAQALRRYFVYDDVLEGVMGVFEELFGLRFEREERVRTWHHSVRVYNAYEGDWLVGRFFLDMHPRPDKYEHAAMFPMGIDREAGRLPTAALVANLPNPKQTRGPALLAHAQVRSLFHEFGHIVHYLLAATSPWSNQAGMNVELDFVEAPAQLFEEYAWSPEVLRRFARHAETGEPIPVELVEKLRASAELGRGLELMRQVYYTALSAHLHAADPEALDLARFQQQLMARYSPYPYPEGTYGYASFGHLEVYSSMYYVYQWSLGLAKDMLTRFEQEGLLNPALARAYADTVLRPGGSKDALELTRDFLGREPSLDAYREWLATR